MRIFISSSFVLTYGGAPGSLGREGGKGAHWAGEKKERVLLMGGMKEPRAMNRLSRCYRRAKCFALKKRDSKKVKLIRAEKKEEGDAKLVCS